MSARTLASGPELCHSDLPSLEKDLDAAVIALEPWKPIAVVPSAAQDRAPASSASEGATDSGRAPKQIFVQPPLAMKDREAWMGWAESKLGQAQERLDEIKKSKELLSARPELSEIATLMVSFHGFSRIGNSEKMVGSLKRMRDLSAAARARVCGSR